MVKAISLVSLLLISAAWLAPVHLHTSWGSLKGSPASVDSAKAALDSPLVVTDDKGSAYTITRFRFSYHQKTEFKDSTGEIKTGYRLFSREFFNTAIIDTFWSNTIRPSVQVGETFYIDKIVVKDGEGKKSFAPSLELNVQ